MALVFVEIVKTSTVSSAIARFFLQLTQKSLAMIFFLFSAFSFCCTKCLCNPGSVNLLFLLISNWSPARYSVQVCQCCFCPRAVGLVRVSVRHGEEREPHTDDDDGEHYPADTQSECCAAFAPCAVYVSHGVRALWRNCKEQNANLWSSGILPNCCISFFVCFQEKTKKVKKVKWINTKCMFANERQWRCAFCGGSRRHWHRFVNTSHCPCSSLQLSSMGLWWNTFFFIKDKLTSKQLLWPQKRKGK